MVVPIREDLDGGPFGKGQPGHKRACRSITAVRMGKTNGNGLFGMFGREN